MTDLLRDRVYAVLIADNWDWNMPIDKVQGLTYEQALEFVHDYSHFEPVLMIIVNTTNNGVVLTRSK